jgi:hypothetical protein
MNGRGVDSARIRRYGTGQRNTVRYSIAYCSTRETGTVLILHSAVHHCHGCYGGSNLYSSMGIYHAWRFGYIQESDTTDNGYPHQNDAWR